jgi:hypothetical protein
MGWQPLLTFLFSTQRDMFDQTVAAVAGVAAAVPSIMRVVTAVAGRSLKESGPEVKTEDRRLQALVQRTGLSRRRESRRPAVRGRA